MSFRETLDNLALRESPLIREFKSLIAPKSDRELEAMAQQSHSLTLRNFGRTMRLFAPLYVSNECINNCRYCGFSRDNPILRTTLTPEQIGAEARHLAEEGFRQVLLVAGEHPKFISDDYLAQCVRTLAQHFSSVSIEVGPLATADYAKIVDAGADGLVVYQETYNRAVYAEMHTSGPKRDFDWRLDCPVRGYEAGFRRLGIGVLLGLSSWQDEAVPLAAHIEYLLKRCWQSQITVSLPRLRPAAADFRALFPVGDRDFAQLICALRIAFPEIGIVLSTREPATFRDALSRLGVTMMSAGSHTEPGGYTGQAENLHFTVRGKVVAPEFSFRSGELAEQQFDISDERTPLEVAAALRRGGIEPVWKDWDQTLTR